MAKYLYPFVLLFILTFGSCQTVEQISIDYMLPADVSFPAELRKVGIINNVSPIPDNQLMPKENKMKKGDEISRAVAYHYGLEDAAVSSLAEAIADQNYFDEVVICDSALRADDLTSRQSTLSTQEVNELTRNLDVDFLISLESLQMRATKVVSHLTQWNVFYGTLDTKVFPVIKVYLPNRKGPMVTINANDSIFWEEYGDTEASIQAKLPTDLQLILQASDFAGTIPTKYLIPYWKTSNRYLYLNGSVAMRDGAVYAREKKWDEAFKLWEQAYLSSKSDKKKMRAAHNIALYYEMSDSLVEAEKWAIQAQTLARKIDKVDEKIGSNLDINSIPNYYTITLYVTELHERTEGLSKLRGQMSRFNDDF